MLAGVSGEQYSEEFDSHHHSQSAAPVATRTVGLQGGVKGGTSVSVSSYIESFVEEEEDKLANYTAYRQPKQSSVDIEESYADSFIGRCCSLILLLLSHVCDVCGVLLLPSLTESLIHNSEESIA